MNSEWQSMLMEDLNAKLLQREDLIGQSEELEELLEYHKINSSFEYEFACKIEQLDEEIQGNLKHDVKIKDLIAQREQVHKELAVRVKEQTAVVFEQYMANWISDFKGFRVLHGEEKYQQLLKEQQQQIQGMISSQYSKKIQGIIKIKKSYKKIDQSIKYNIQFVNKELAYELKLLDKNNESVAPQKKDETLQLSLISQQAEVSKLTSFIQQDDSLLQHMDEFNILMSKPSHKIKLQTIYEEHQNNIPNIRSHHHSKTVFSYKHSTVLSSPQFSKYFPKEMNQNKKAMTKGTLLFKKFSNKPSKRELDLFQNQNPTQFGYGLRMAQLQQDRIEFRNQLKPQLIDSQLPLSQILRVIIPKQINGYLKKKQKTQEKEKENASPQLQYWPLQIITLNHVIRLVQWFDEYEKQQLMKQFKLLTFVGIAYSSPIQTHIHHQQSLAEDFKHEIFYVGFTCFLFGTIILWFNERKAAINSFRLQHARSSCVSITPFQESSGNELVHLNGQLVTDELVTDSEFGISQINCIKLLRVVEMYQWNKAEKQQEQQWVDHYVENDFGYTNDKSKLIVNPHEFINKSIQIGQYDVPEEMKKQINSTLETVKLNQANITIAKQQFKDRGFKSFTLQNDTIYFNQVENQLINGDLRISFKYSPCSDVTILAKAVANTFVTWQFDDQLNATVQKDYEDLNSIGELIPIKEIYWIFNELLTAEECFSKFVSENSTCLWILRGLAYILMAIGSMILFPSLQKLTSMRDLEGISFFLFNLAAAIPLTIFVLSFAWIYYRRKIGISLLLASLALGGGVYYYAYKRA